jgi:hypothetical protein
LISPVFFGAGLKVTLRSEELFLESLQAF